MTDTAVEDTSPLPVIEKLDDPPTIEELSKATDSPSSGKAPGNDGTPEDVIKADKDTSLLEHIHEHCYSAGRKEVCLMTCATPISSRSTKTKAIVAIATTIAEYLSLALSARLSRASCSKDGRH